MARHLAGKGHDIAVTRRSASVSSALARDIGATVGTAQEVVDASDVVFLCVRPHQAEAALAGLRFRAGQQVVSVIAGISRAWLERACAPATRIVQTIPLGYLETGGCPLAAFGDAEILEPLFAPQNPVIPVASEAALNAHFAICALVPGVLDILATGADWLAAQTGDRAGGEYFTTQLMTGFLGALDPARTHVLAEERDALATEGTLSLMMVNGMRDGATDATRRALDAIGQRLEAAT
jgi:pyrroline-5-carboxylate reductase